MARFEENCSSCRQTVAWSCSCGFRLIQARRSSPFGASSSVAACHNHRSLPDRGYGAATGPVTGACWPCVGNTPGHDDHLEPDGLHSGHHLCRESDACHRRGLQPHGGGRVRRVGAVLRDGRQSACANRRDWMPSQSRANPVPGWGGSDLGGFKSCGVPSQLGTNLRASHPLPHLDDSGSMPSSSPSGCISSADCQVGEPNMSQLITLKHGVAGKSRETSNGSFRRELQ